MIDPEKFYSNSQAAAPAAKAPTTEDERIAAVLFGKSTPSAPLRPGNGPTSPEDGAAATLFPSMASGAKSEPKNTAALYPNMAAPKATQAAVAPQPTSMDKAAQAMFGDSLPEAYDYTAPEDLAHLGLQVEPQAAKEWTQIFKGLGLKQEQVTTLVHQHLRQIYGGES